MFFRYKIDHAHQRCLRAYEHTPKQVSLETLNFIVQEHCLPKHDWSDHFQ